MFPFKGNKGIGEQNFYFYFINALEIKLLKVKRREVEKVTQKAKVDYDSKNDTLWIYLEEPVRDSIEIDNFVIDFSRDNRIVGVEIFNASKLISKLTLGKVTKQMLSKIRAATLSPYQSKELVFIIVGLLLRRKEISIQIPAPLVVVE